MDHGNTAVQRQFYNLRKIQYQVKKEGEHEMLLQVEEQRPILPRIGICGTPQSGKTSMAYQLAANVVERERKVGNGVPELVVISESNCIEEVKMWWEHVQGLSVIIHCYSSMNKLLKFCPVLNRDYIVIHDMLNETSSPDVFLKRNGISPLSFIQVHNNSSVGNNYDVVLCRVTTTDSATTAHWHSFALSSVGCKNCEISASQQRLLRLLSQDQLFAVFDRCGNVKFCSNKLFDVPQWPTSDRLQLVSVWHQSESAFRPVRFQLSELPQFDKEQQQQEKLEKDDVGGILHSVVQKAEPPKEEKTRLRSVKKNKQKDLCFVDELLHARTLAQQQVKCLDAMLMELDV